MESGRNWCGRVLFQIAQKGTQKQKLHFYSQNPQNSKCSQYEHHFPLKIAVWTPWALWGVVVEYGWNWCGRVLFQITQKGTQKQRKLHFNSQNPQNCKCSQCEPDFSQKPRPDPIFCMAANKNVDGGGVLLRIGMADAPKIDGGWTPPPLFYSAKVS